MNEQNTFPVHMKSFSGRNFYCIHGEEEMTELQIIGGKFQVHRIQATILPERVLIQDLLNSSSELYPRISAEEFESEIERCKRDLVEIS